MADTNNNYDISIGLTKYRCMQCGKEFQSRVERRDWVYRDRRYKEHPVYYCSWKCLRAAEKQEKPTYMKDTPPTKIKNPSEPVRLMFGQIIMREGVWRKTTEMLPDRRRIVAVKMYYQTSNMVYPTVAEFIPAGEVCRGTRQNRICKEDTWVSTSPNKRQFHNVLEWYDDEGK